MRSGAGTPSLTDAQRKANDRHRPAVVVAVLAMLAVYLYLFTHAPDALGLPGPKTVAESIGATGDYAYDPHGAMASFLQITLVEVFRPGDRLAIFFLMLAAGFLAAYFLPLRYKQPSLVVCTAVAVLLLYGATALAGLLCAHLIVYLVLHPAARRDLVPSALAGACGYVAFAHDVASGSWNVPLLAGLVLGSVVAYRYGLVRLLQLPRLAGALRTLVVQSAILVVCVGAAIQGLGGTKWVLPGGVLLFFWQWERLIMYHLDHRDGRVPRDLPLLRYLAVFWNPGVVPTWTWGATIGQGYTYTRDGFLCRDKNELALGGVKLWALALGYLLVQRWAVLYLVRFFESLGVEVHNAHVRSMVQRFVDGGEVGTASVLLTSLLELTNWIMIWCGVTHFKVGVWRVCGYRMAPYINRPWAATNLVNFWPRITFHYREFLVRAFYVPVFLRFFKKHPTLRIVAATLAAAGFGNLVWGHVTEELYYRGLLFDHLITVLRTWPYFLLLGLGVGLSHLYLRRRRSARKPWTLDRWIVTDVLAAYATLQYFSLIHIFARQVPDSTLWDHCRLFLRGFGISL